MAGSAPCEEAEAFRDALYLLETFESGLPHGMKARRVDQICLIGTGTQKEQGCFGYISAFAYRRYDRIPTTLVTPITAKTKAKT